MKFHLSLMFLSFCHYVNGSSLVSPACGCSLYRQLDGWWRPASLSLSKTSSCFTYYENFDLQRVSLPPSGNQISHSHVVYVLTWRGGQCHPQPSNLKLPQPATGAFNLGFLHNFQQTTITLYQEKQKPPRDSEIEINYGKLFATKFQPLVELSLLRNENVVIYILSFSM